MRSTAEIRTKNEDMYQEALRLEQVAQVSGVFGVLRIKEQLEYIHGYLSAIRWMMEGEA